MSPEFIVGKGNAEVVQVLEIEHRPHPAGSDHIVDGENGWRNDKARNEVVIGCRDES